MAEVQFSFNRQGGGESIRTVIRSEANAVILDHLDGLGKRQLAARLSPLEARSLADAIRHAAQEASK